MILHLLLFGLIAFIGRAVFVYVSPRRTCPWCAGERKRFRCLRCKGRGEVWRPGARLARRAHVAAVRAWRERRYER